MMDTGRISLPSIDTMLNSTSTPIDLQHTDTLSPGVNKDYHRSSLSQYQQPPSYHHYHHPPPPVSPPLSSSSLDSLPWRSGHSRSISLDSNQVMASTFSSKLSPPRIGALVPPSHQGSAISTTVSPSSPSSLSSTSSSSPSSISTSTSSSYHLTGGINENYRHHPYARPLPPPPPNLQHHHHSTNPTTSHHRRAISTSCINTLSSVGKSHQHNNNNRNIGSNGSGKHVISSFMDTPQRKYLCHECYKSFSRPSSLRTHMFSHSGEKPFACPHPGCDRTFSVQSNMRRHIRVHYSASLASPK